MLKIQQMLEELKDWAEGERPLDIVVQGVEQGRGVMSNRIFNSEKGAKGVDGKGFGRYSNEYAKIRSRKGLQTKVIDFSFTESLQKDVKTVRNGNKITIAIQSDVNRLKAGYLEKRYSSNIFDLNKKEKDQILAAIKLNMDKDFEEITAKYL